MATLQVEKRDFERSAAGWLRKARQGDTVVIVSSEGPPLTLTAGRPKRAGQPAWARHFKWLKKQPAFETNLVDDLRQYEKR
jgi:antitoxin (DNA-binding transcriptional repressor) of toxin-antitoxin stability system